MCINGKPRRDPVTSSSSLRGTTDHHHTQNICGWFLPFLIFFIFYFYTFFFLFLFGLFKLLKLRKRNDFDPTESGGILSLSLSFLKAFFTTSSNARVEEGGFSLWRHYFIEIRRLFKKGNVSNNMALTSPSSRPGVLPVERQWSQTIAKQQDTTRERSWKRRNGQEEREREKLIENEKKKRTVISFVS